MGLDYFRQFFERILDEFECTGTEREEMKQKLGVDMYHHLLKAAWPTFPEETQKFFKEVTADQSTDYACIILLETIKGACNEAIIGEAKKSFYKKVHSRVIFLND